MLTRTVSDLQSDSSQTGQSDLADPISTAVIQVTEVVNNSDSVQDPESQPLKLESICTGALLRIDAESCRDRFEEAGNTLSLGETFIFVTNIGNRSNNLEFSINDSDNPIVASNIDAAIASLKVDLVHSVRVRKSGQTWSNALDFQVDLRPPSEAYIVDVCANLRCASKGTIAAPLNPRLNAFYPLVEDVLGLARSPTEHMWIELMLDSDMSFLGCLNCGAAQAAEVPYLNRKEFGETGIFYNWDITDLDTGSYSLQARLRNKFYVGPWSSEFVFEVERE